MFDHVILFAEDLNLGDNASVYNQYVAVIREHNKVIIVKFQLKKRFLIKSLVFAR